MKTILFVCTGNTCRSPMAEALFRLRAPADLPWRAESAGVCAARGAPASSNAVRAIEEVGGDLSEHRSRPVSRETARNAARIVALCASHRDALTHAFPELADRVCLIKSFGTSRVPADIFDPFGGSIETYRKTRDEIDRALSDLILRLREEERQTKDLS